MTGPEFIFSFFVTWTVVLVPPVLIRMIRKKPTGKPASFGLCIFLYFSNVIFFTSLGSQSSSHGALILGAVVSYYVLRMRSSPKNAPLAHDPKFASAQAELDHYVGKLVRNEISDQEFEQHKKRILGPNA